MKAPHLLAVGEPPEAFAPLLGAARAAGVRIGWLELGEGAETAPLPAPLAAAAGLGARRAVAAGGGASVAVKPLAGPPVLRDLLREHFLGCALVLVRGAARERAGVTAADLPRLAPAGEAWALELPGAPPRRLTTEELLAALRRPRLGPRSA